MTINFVCMKFNNWGSQKSNFVCMKLIDVLSSLTKIILLFFYFILFSEILRELNSSREGGR
jgi:hypothetical protein